MTITENIKRDVELLVQTAQELVNRVDHPERIPDTCYRGDVSRWNFGYFLSRREKLGTDITNQAGADLKDVILHIYGDKSPEIKAYNRALVLCDDYKEMYGLTIKEI